MISKRELTAAVDMSIARIRSIFEYPLKSAAGLSRSEAYVNQRGINADRHWMLIDSNQKFVSARTHPKLLLIKINTTTNGLQVCFPAQAPHPSATFFIYMPEQNESNVVEVTLWDDQVQSLLAPGCDAYFSEFLQSEVRLVYQPENLLRLLSPKYAQQNDHTAFADGYPILILSQASLDELAQRMQAPIQVTNFRPNILVENIAAHAEDDWHRIRIGECELELVKPCVRCVLTTIDPLLAKAHPLGEPLRTLKTYRRSAKGITFGMNVIPRKLGKIRVGDPIELI